MIHYVALPDGDGDDIIMMEWPPKKAKTTHVAGMEEIKGTMGDSDNI
jgi:hypothetical protein